MWEKDQDKEELGELHQELKIDEISNYTGDQLYVCHIEMETSFVGSVPNVSRVGKTKWA